MNEFPSFKRDGHPPFKYEGQGLTGEVITSACNVLDIAGIPSVLWGELLMRVHGVDFVVQQFELCIHDENLDRAYDILHARGFLACLKGPDCPESPESKERRNYPAAAKHLHLAEPDSRPLLLHKKSETLWAVPTFVHSSLKENPDAGIILASDEALAYDPVMETGPYSKDLLPVRIPSAHCLLEAYILLIARDYNPGEHGKTIADSWIYMITFLRRPLQDQNIDPRCRAFYESLFLFEKPLRKCLRRLKQSMEETR